MKKMVSFSPTPKSIESKITFPVLYNNLLLLSKPFWKYLKIRYLIGQSSQRNNPGISFEKQQLFRIDFPTKSTGLFPPVYS